jgi:hypothetical protein
MGSPERQWEGRKRSAEGVRMCEKKTSNKEKFMLTNTGEVADKGAKDLARRQ